MRNASIFQDVTKCSDEVDRSKMCQCCPEGEGPGFRRLQALSKGSLPLAEHLPMGVAYLDRTLHFRYFNQPYANMVRDQYSAVLLLDAYLPDVIGTPAYQKIEAELILVRSAIPACFVRTVLQDGRLQMLEIRYFPDADVAGVVSGFYSIVTDVTRELATDRKSVV